MAKMNLYFHCPENIGIRTIFSRQLDTAVFRGWFSSWWKLTSQRLENSRWPWNNAKTHIQFGAFQYLDKKILQLMHSWFPSCNRDCRLDLSTKTLQFPERCWFVNTLFEDISQIRHHPDVGQNFQNINAVYSHKKKVVCPLFFDPRRKNMSRKNRSILFHGNRYPLVN